MEQKNIEPTINRPEGERLIDAPFVFADLEKYTLQLKKEEAWKKSDRNSITVYKTKGTTIVLTCLHKDAMIDKNKVEGWLTLQVLDGVVELTVEENNLALNRLQLMTFHPGVLHSIRAKTEATLLLINKT
jgi:quercetin dioxygenase-like cupin family protein